MKKIILTLLILLTSFCVVNTTFAQSYYDVTFDNLNDVNILVSNELRTRVIPINYSLEAKSLNDVVYDYTINAIEFLYGYIVVNDHLWLQMPQHAVLTYETNETYDLIVRFENYTDVNMNGNLIDLGPITWYQQYNFTPQELYTFLESKVLNWAIIMQFNTEIARWFLRLQVGESWRQFDVTTYTQEDFPISTVNIQGHTEEMIHTEYLYQRWYHYETEYVPPVPELTGFSEWIVDGVGAFLDFEIVPGISITNILLFCLALGLMFVFLRFFMGG